MSRIDSGGQSLCWMHSVILSLIWSTAGASGHTVLDVVVIIFTACRCMAVASRLFDPPAEVEDRPASTEGPLGDSGNSINSTEPLLPLSPSVFLLPSGHFVRHSSAIPQSTLRARPKVPTHSTRSPPTFDSTPQLLHSSSFHLLTRSLLSF